MKPIELRRGSAAHRLVVAVLSVLAVAVVVYIPFASDAGFAPGSIDKAYRVTQINHVIAFAVAILGLTVVTGWSGQVSLGQSAFVGLGAYSTVILVADHHWSYYAALPASALLCFAAGMLIGIPATRIRGMYLGVVTLCLAYVFPSLVRKWAWLTGGVNGKGPARTEARLLPPSWMPYADTRFLARPLWVYCLSVVVAGVAFLMAWNLRRSRPGRALLASRDDTAAAVSFGVNVSLYKAMAFGVSAACGGIAGSLLMMNRPFATDGQYDTSMAIFLVVGLVVGGSGTLSGAVVGSAVYLFVPYFVSEWALDQSGMPPGLRQLLGPLFRRLHEGGGAVGVFFGVVLLLVLFFAPGGVMNGVTRAAARFVRVTDVPPEHSDHAAPRAH